MPRNDISKRADHKEISAKGGRNCSKGKIAAAAKSRELKKMMLALRDLPLPEEQQSESCKTYGEAWIFAMSEKILKGENGAVEAFKVMQGLLGEDTAEKQEIVVKVDSSAGDIMG
jgi:hypothetical protein